MLLLSFLWCPSKLLGGLKLVARMLIVESVAFMSVCMWCCCQLCGVTVNCKVCGVVVKNVIFLSSLCCYCKVCGVAVNSVVLLSRLCLRCCSQVCGVAVKSVVLL